MGVPGAKTGDGSGKEAPASGGGLDWLTQVAQPDSDAAAAAAGKTRESGSSHTRVSTKSTKFATVPYDGMDKVTWVARSIGRV